MNRNVYKIVSGRDEVRACFATINKWEVNIKGLRKNNPLNMFYYLIQTIIIIIILIFLIFFILMCF